MAKNPRIIDLTGSTFGLWTVHKKHGNTPRGAAVWWCSCTCGIEKAVVGSDLRRGASTNCGCKKAERAAVLNRTHGESRTRLHGIWVNMNRRGRDDTHKVYAKVTVCPEWQEYEPFRDWSLANGYAPDLSIDRVDGRYGYSPQNCRWATPATQSQNRAFVSRAPDGRLWSHVAKSNGIPERTYRVRLSAGWDREEAATHPYKTRRKSRKRNLRGQYI